MPLTLISILTNTGERHVLIKLSNDKSDNCYVKTYKKRSLQGNLCSFPSATAPKSHF